MAGLLTSLGPSGAALSLLVLGHVLADFAFQTNWMVANKNRPGPLLAHGAVVLVVHGLVLLPMLALDVVLLVFGIAASHMAIDGLKTRFEGSDDPSVLTFSLDQAAHGIVLFAAWMLLPGEVWDESPLALAIGGLSSEAWTWMTVGAVYLAVFVFAHHGCNAIIRGLLPQNKLDEGGQGLEAGGRTIGTLERWIVLLLGIAGAWGAVALVIGAKAVARFEELKDRRFAEYFLIGTLASVVSAILLVFITQAV